VGPGQMAEQHSLIDDLFFGFEAPNLNDLMRNTGSGEAETGSGRTRRVTISEITAEEDNEWMMVQDTDSTDTISSGGSSSEDESILTTDEIFQILDESVQDWKTNLEVAVGEGLKKLRKSTKDSKLKIKYLPGESVGNKKLIAPKNLVLKEWKDEFEAAIQNVQSKLDKLARDKMAEVTKLYQEKLLSKGQKSLTDPKKKDLITIDCRETKKAAGSHQSLKQMVRELDKMVLATQATNFDNCVPIYNLSPNLENKNNVVATPYEFPLQKYLKYLKEANTTVAANPFQQPIVDNPKPKVDLKQFVANNQTKIMDALDDMKLKQMKKEEQQPPKIKEQRIKQTLFKDDLLKKEVRRETSAMSKRGKMMERSQQRTRKNKKRDATITNQGFTYRLRQYSVNGEEHYLIVKKRIPNDEEVEDIFQDWCHNLTVRKPKRIPRVRKLSHRAQRKEYLKENSYPIPKTGPISYADALKKNLKYRPNYIPAEDVFETWRDCLDVDAAAEDQKNRPQQQPPQHEQVLLQSTERAMEMGVIECGQPTVRMAAKGQDQRLKQAIKATTTPVMVSSGGGRGLARAANRKALQPEELFAAWRYNLNDDEFLPKRLPKIGKKYAVEEYFRVWRRNLYVKEKYPRRAVQLRMMPENIFGDWLHNFNTGGSDHHYQRGYHNPRHHHQKHQPNVAAASNSGLTAEPLSKKSRNNNQRRSKNKKNSNKNNF